MVSTLRYQTDCKRHLHLFSARIFILAAELKAVALTLSEEREYDRVREYDKLAVRSHFIYVRLKSSLHQLQLLRRTLRHCSAVKLQKCFLDDKTSPDLRNVYCDWIFSFGLNRFLLSRWVTSSLLADVCNQQMPYLIIKSFLPLWSEPLSLHTGVVQITRVTVLTLSF